MVEVSFWVSSRLYVLTLNFYVVLLTGDSSEAFHGPGNLLDKDVIFVSLNYRLGVFGFLTLGDELLPGNLGMISFLRYI